MKIVKNSLLLIIVAMILTVSIQNLEAFSRPIPFKILNSEPVKMPFALWALLCFAIGYVFAFLLGLKKTFGDKSERKKLQKKIDALDKELVVHRNKFLDQDDAPIENEFDSLDQGKKIDEV